MVRGKVAGATNGKQKAKRGVIKKKASESDQSSEAMDDESIEEIADASVKKDSDEDDSEDEQNGVEDADDDDDEEGSDDPQDNCGTISKESLGFWALRLDHNCQRYTWHVGGAAELNETDFHRDPDFIEVSLEISQISIEPQTSKSDCQCVQVATSCTSDDGPVDDDQWYTIAFLDSKNPFISTKLSFSPANRPVMFRLAAGEGPVTIAGRMIHRVNELTAKEAVELCKAVELDNQADDVEDDEAENDHDEEDEDEDEAESEESPVSRPTKAQVKLAKVKVSPLEKKSKKRPLKTSPAKSKTIPPTKKARNKSR